MNEERIQPDVVQNLPALYTIDGRQYELKIVSKKTSIAPADPRPVAPFIPGITFGINDGSIVPIDNEAFNIFLIPLNKIIPLKYIASLTNAAGANAVGISNCFYTVVDAIAIQTNIVKTTEAQAKIQFLMTSNSFPAQAFPFDFKIFKQDFFDFRYPERIIFTGNDFNTLVDFQGVTNGSNWNMQAALTPGVQFWYTQTFTYLELL